jgi:protoheme IX farnesyltransferase
MNGRDPLRALWALTKPSVTRMCVLTTTGGLLLAPGTVSWTTGACALLGTAAAVGGANAFNMWWERDADAKMSRTRRRPLPARILPPQVAWYFAWALSLVAVAVLGLGTNLLTAVLAAAAIAGYVLVYTPLKYRTPAALVIGAVPGAMPPLLGWTAVTGSVDAPAVVLAAILFLWQLPHFLAIALYRAEDYAKAGIKVVPLVRGTAIAKIQAVAWTMVLVPVSLMLVPMGVAGDRYMLVAFLAGTAFLGWSFTGLDNRAGTRWARGFFFASLVYLPALMIALALDVGL